MEGEFDSLNDHFDRQKEIHEAQLARETSQHMQTLRKATRGQAELSHPKVFSIKTNANAGEALFLRAPCRLPESDHKLGQSMVPGTRFDGAIHEVPWHKPKAQVIKGSSAFPDAVHDTSVPPKVVAMMAALGVDHVIPQSIPASGTSTVANVSPLKAGAAGSGSGTLSSTRRTPRNSFGSVGNGGMGLGGMNGLGLGGAGGMSSTANSTRQSSPLTVGMSGTAPGSPMPVQFDLTAPSLGAAGARGGLSLSLGLVSAGSGLGSPPMSPALSPLPSPMLARAGARVAAGAGSSGQQQQPQQSSSSSAHSSRRSSPVRDILDRAELDQRKRFWVYLTSTLGNKEVTADEASLLFSALTKEEKARLPLLPAAHAAVDEYGNCGDEAELLMAAPPQQGSLKPKATRPGSAAAAATPASSSSSPQHAIAHRQHRGHQHHQDDQQQNQHQGDRFAKSSSWLASSFPQAAGPGPGASTSLNRTAIGYQTVRQTLHQAPSSPRAPLSPSSGRPSSPSAFFPSSPSPRGGGLSTARGATSGRSPSPSPSPPSPTAFGSTGAAHHPRPWRRGASMESLPHRQLFAYHATVGANTVGLGKMRALPGQMGMASAGPSPPSSRPSSPPRKL